MYLVTEARLRVCCQLKASLLNCEDRFCSEMFTVSGESGLFCSLLGRLGLFGGWFVFLEGEKQDLFACFVFCFGLFVFSKEQKLHCYFDL